MADLPRLRRHTDGRWAVLADPEDPWPWFAGDDGWLMDKHVSGEGWSELAVVELPEPTSVEPDHVAWRGAELHIHGPGATTICPSLPDDQAGWDDAPGYVREVIAPSLLAAALRAQHGTETNNAEEATHDNH